MIVNGSWWARVRCGLGLVMVGGWFGLRWDGIRVRLRLGLCVS